MPLPELKKSFAAPIASALKPRGFCKQGMNFRALRPEAELIINIQSSRDSTADSLKVTVNLGIILNSIHEHFSSLNRAVWTAEWRQRIGHYIPGCSGDYWWICESDQEAARAGAEIANVLEKKALPEMEHLALTSNLVAYWRSGQGGGLTPPAVQERLNYLDRIGTVP